MHPDNQGGGEVRIRDQPKPTTNPVRVLQELDDWESGSPKLLEGLRASCQA
jgi:hypothetical protein